MYVCVCGAMKGGSGRPDYSHSHFHRGAWQNGPGAISSKYFFFSRECAQKLKTNLEERQHRIPSAPLWPLLWTLTSSRPTQLHVKLWLLWKAGGFPFLFHTIGLDNIRAWPMGGHNMTVKNTITSWGIKSITSPNPLNLRPRFRQMLDDFHLIHFRRWIHPVSRGKPVMKMH